MPPEGPQREREQDDLDIEDPNETLLAPHASADQDEHGWEQEEALTGPVKDAAAPAEPSKIPAPAVSAGPSILPDLVQRAVATGMLTAEEAWRFPDARSLGHTVQLLEAKLAKGKQAELEEASREIEAFELDLPAEGDEGDWDPRIRKNLQGLHKFSLGARKMLAAQRDENQRLRQDLERMRAEARNADFDAAMDRMLEQLPETYYPKLGKGRSRDLQRGSPEWQERLELGKLIVTLAEAGTYQSFDDVFQVAVRARYPSQAQETTNRTARRELAQAGTPMMPPSHRTTSSTPTDPTARATLAAARKLRQYGVRPGSD